MVPLQANAMNVYPDPDPVAVAAIHALAAVVAVERTRFDQDKRVVQKIFHLIKKYAQFNPASSHQKDARLVRAIFLEQFQ